MSKPPKINVTKNYRLFTPSDGNRPLDIAKHRKLKASMEECGFIPCLPIICERMESGVLQVKDGQHRLHFAEELGLPVYWVEDESGFNVAKINNTPKTWVPRDYAQMHATSGLADYQEGLAFHEEYGVPVALSFCLLAGVTGFSPISEKFYAGEFVVKDRDWAKAVASIYTAMVKLEPKMKSARFLLACMAVCRVAGFSAKRMAASAERCRHKLASFADRDSYLKMLEEVYNHGQKSLCPLRIEAQKAMRERNVGVSEDAA